MTPFDMPIRTYLVPAGSNAADVLAELVALLSAGPKARRKGPPPLAPVARPVQMTTWNVLDTADLRLRDAGLDLGLETASASAQLVLRENGARGVSAVRVPRSQRRFRLQDLPAGRVKDRLAPLIEVRALLPIVELRRRDQPVEVHNPDAKTVVRLTLTDLWATPGTDPVRLPGRVEVAAVLGYPKPFARVDGLLHDRLGLQPATTRVVDDAAALLGDQLPAATVSHPPPFELAADDPAGDAAVRILGRLADAVEANLPGALDDLDPEFLHDLRVAVRRSRSVLREMKRVFDPAARRVQAEALRWIQAVTGPTRDLDVQLLEWDELVAHLPDERQEDVEVAHRVLAARRGEAFRRMKATLRGSEYQERWAGWRRFLEDQAAVGGDGQGVGSGPDAHRPVRRVAGGRIRSVYRRMVRDGRAIDDQSPAEALHDLRKRGKELRYLLELFGSVLPERPVRRMVASLKALQDVLGRHQDREIQADNLRALAPELAALPGGADALLALGALVDRLRVEQREAREQFAERFAAFEGLKVPS